MNASEKYQQYLQLMKYKKQFGFYNFLLAVFAMAICNIFNLPIWIALVVSAIYLYISQFWFLAKNTCPWCHEPFFLYTSKGYAGGGGMLFQNKCINCHRPNRNDIA